MQIECFLHSWNIQQKNICMGWKESDDENSTSIRSKYDATRWDEMPFLSSILSHPYIVLFLRLFLPISRVLTYSFILVCAICVYAEGFPLASLVDNNALIFMFPVPCSRWWWWWLRRSIYSNLAIPPCHLMWLLLSLSLCLFFPLSLQQRRGKQNLISCKWNKIKWFCWCLLSKYCPCMVISPMLKHSFDFYIYGFPVEFFFHWNELKPRA